MKMDNATVQTKYRIVRDPELGSGSRHAVWRVYEHENLICVCSYLKGAEALVEHLCETDRRMRELAIKTLMDLRSQRSDLKPVS